tara:strand:+ start:682 stop:1137 length:456 start_codon:yes stop_codon:yes gene_type:complete
MDDTLRDYCDREIIGTLGATCVNASSDDRLKFNEVEITNALEVINQLTPKVYDKSKELNVNEDTFREAGVIAQEVLNTDLSFCVTGGDTIDVMTNANIERPYQVNYNDILAYLIASVKELNNIVIKQQETIIDLVAKNKALENRTTILENS